MRKTGKFSDRYEWEPGDVKTLVSFYKRFDTLEDPADEYFTCEGCGNDTIVDDDCDHGFCTDCAGAGRCRTCERIWDEEQEDA